MAPEELEPLAADLVLPVQVGCFCQSRFRNFRSTGTDAGRTFPRPTGSICGFPWNKKQSQMVFEVSREGVAQVGKTRKTTAGPGGALRVNGSCGALLTSSRFEAKFWPEAAWDLGVQASVGRCLAACRSTWFVSAGLPVHLCLLRWKSPKKSKMVWRVASSCCKR